MAQDDRTAKDPKTAEKAVITTDGELTDEQLENVAGGYATMLSNLANMRHEMLKTVANNLRA